MEVEDAPSVDDECACADSTAHDFPEARRR